jgi:hypothetical protein
MQGALRQDLTSLVQALDRAGYEADAVTPVEFLTRQAGLAGAGLEISGASTGQGPRNSGENTSGDPRHSAEDGQQRQQQQREQQQPQQSRERRPPPQAWRETLETLS